MKRYIAYFLVAMLTACAGGGTGTNATTTPAQAVFAAKQNYAVALTIAVAYKKLPACALPTSPVLCSKKEVVTQLQKIDDASAALLDGAEVTVRSGATGADLAIKAAEQAVSAFTTITNSLAVK